MSRRSLIRSAMVAGLIAFVATLVAQAWAASASNIDIRGSWDEVCTTQGTDYPQTMTVVTEDLSSGAVTGTDVGGGATFSLSGTVSGTTFTWDIQQNGGPYTAHAVMTISSSNGTLTLKGPFTDNNGAAGVCTASASGSTSNSPGSSQSSPPAGQGPLPSSAAGGTRPSAVMVQCNRDVTNPDIAHFQCTALVADAGTPTQSQLPTGSVTWTAAVGSFSSRSCSLSLPDVGVPRCGVAFTASNHDVPIETAVPVTASYSGDGLYRPSKGSPKLGPGLAQPNDGVSPLVLLLGLAGGAGLLGLAAFSYMKLHAGATAANLVGDPAGTESSQATLEEVGRIIQSIPGGKGGAGGKGGTSGKGAAIGKGGGTAINPADLEKLRQVIQQLPDQGGKSGSGGGSMSTEDLNALNQLLQQFGGDSPGPPGI